MYISENSEKHWIVEHPCEIQEREIVEKGMSEREA